ncbi:DUF3761 domain-containing protein [Tunturibacter empetritectus]|uniref:DUF3761 domain-containing protein n=2 Tax=Tunturiibacter empetritectus TaxID=3069691 RepID=A0A7W8IIE1_9BACT|nr:DUF3761 domain-containing protein [Edaphobacter lichenicola]MBB5317732.1 hypothetical protein [Edaphobacter lichenicola]
MKISMCLMAVAVGLVGAQMAVAQAAAPAGSTGMCKDGTYSTAASKAGACRGHQGVKEWYAASTAKAPAAATAPAAAPAAAAKTAPVAAPAAAAATAPAAAAGGGTSGKLSPSQKAAARPQAAGGGPGLVWVNTSSNVYHCYGSDFYGKTKEGSYMSEADAKAKGAHGDHGKSCTK